MTDKYHIVSIEGFSLNDENGKNQNYRLVYYRDNESLLHTARIKEEDFIMSNLQQLIENSISQPNN